MKASYENQLCLECGLCCNGVIFDKGQLQAGDDAARLKSLGLALLRSSGAQPGNRKFSQPCAAFDGCRCRIYGERPQYCREFECLLLKSVKSGTTKPAAARHVIRRARRRAEQVKHLLRELGDMDEQAAVSTRFRRVQRQMEASAITKENAGLFGELTLAVHDLNMLLGEAFYPGQH